MRSGSSAHDGRGWSPAPHPHPGRGPQPDRGDVPLGPEVSWPAGFRQVDFDSGEYRQLVESSHPRDEYEHVDPRHNGGPAAGYQPQPGPGTQPVPGYPQAPGYQPGPGYQAGPVYQAPVADDYGYGDPGYADPSYDGPRDQAGYAAPPLPPAYPANPPAYQAPPRPGAPLNADPIYPVTGAQEVYRDEVPPGRQIAHRQRYVEPRYEVPRHEEPRPEEPRYEEPRYEEPRFEAPRTADPRLAGLRYDELRYDELRYDNPGLGQEPGYEEEARYDEPMDDEAWYEELRRGGPAFPQRQPGPGTAPGMAPGMAPGPGHPSGPIGLPGPGSQGSSGNQGAPARFPSGGNYQPGQDRGPGYANPNQNPGGNGPRMAAGQAPARAPMPAFHPAPAYGPPALPAPASLAPALPAPASLAQGPLARAPLGPAGPVGVLTPPAGSQFDAQHVTNARAAAAMMAGPDTVAWDVTAEDELEVEEIDSFEEYWQEDDGGYNALLDDLETETPGRQPRRIGRRRGGSSDHRLWLGLGGVIVVAAAAIFGIIKFEFPSGGVAHELVTPVKVAGYTWAPNLEKSSDLNGTGNKFRSMLGPQATNVVLREYESGPTGPTNAPQIVMFLGGHVPNESPSSSISAFEQQYKGAQVVSAGPMGGEAICVEIPGQTAADSEALCAWFDDDSVAVLASPSMRIDQLATVMRTFRPSVELVKK